MVDNLYVQGKALWELDKIAERESATQWLVITHRVNLVLEINLETKKKWSKEWNGMSALPIANISP